MRPHRSFLSSLAKYESRPDHALPHTDVLLDHLKRLCFLLRLTSTLAPLCSVTTRTYLKCHLWMGCEAELHLQELDKDEDAILLRLACIATAAGIDSRAAFSC